ncbi:hypothetical protein [Nostoc phage N1]|nr:hypothetical protein [Nostoc phage N1]
MFSLTINIYNGDKDSAIAEINTKLDGVLNKMSEVSAKLDTLEALTENEIAEFAQVVANISELRSTVQSQSEEIQRLNDLIASGNAVTPEELFRLDQLTTRISEIVNPAV